MRCCFRLSRASSRLLHCRSPLLRAPLPDGMRQQPCQHPRFLHRQLRPRLRPSCSGPRCPGHCLDAGLRLAGSDVVGPLIASPVIIGPELGCCPAAASARGRHYSCTCGCASDFYVIPRRHLCARGFYARDLAGTHLRSSCPTRSAVACGYAG
jgi:hypothetical protein